MSNCVRYLLPLVAVLLVQRPAAAQKAIIIVRHAERFDNSPDSPLSKAGEERATRLASHLRQLGIGFVYTSEFQRTIQTAEPLVRLLSIKPVVVSSSDPVSLIERLKAHKPDDVILVVGHSNTVPVLLKNLGVAQEVQIAENEFDNLFIVIPRSPAPLLLRLRY